MNMSIVGRIPTSITHRLKDTPAETLYWQFRILRSKTTVTTITTHNQQHELAIPATADWFPKKYADVDYEPLFFQSLEEVLTPDSVYYDVGSRWGLCVRAVCEFGVPEEQIHAFEAHPLNFHYLSKNTQNLRISPIQTFVSDDDSDSTITLDSYAETHRDPSVIKLDVEGAEKKVLDGMDQLLQTSKPVIFVEVHPGYLRNMSNDQFEVIDRLEDAGYNLMVSDHRLDTYDWEQINREQLPEEGDYMIRAMSA